MTTTLALRRPDDFHLHLRDGARMASVIQDSARRFARAIVMPNLNPPITTVTAALEYRSRILACLSEGQDFTPMMTLFLTDHTSPAEIHAAAACEHIYAAKLYPAGSTTNSEHGVTAIESVHTALEAMQEAGLPLLVHGEVTDPHVDVFDREAAFIDRVLTPLLQRFRKLRVVFEHITTREAVHFVRNGPDTLAATITPHHLLNGRSAMFDGGLRPHLYCLPVLKREEDRQALVQAAVGGHPRFFLGTDSAPHPRTAKESACGCAGIYSAHGALELYAQIFESAGALNQLEQFAAGNGAVFYGLPGNSGRVTLEKRDWRVPDTLPFGDGEVVPLFAGEVCHWSLTDA